MVSYLLGKQSLFRRDLYILVWACFSGYGLVIWSKISPFWPADFSCFCPFLLCRTSLSCGAVWRRISCYWSCDQGGRVRIRFHNNKLGHGCHRVGKIGSEKISSWSGKSQGILLQVRENLSLGKMSGKREILRVHIYSFPPTFIVLWHLKFFCTFHGHESCCVNKNIVHEIEWQANVGFSRKSILFCTYCQGPININVQCTWLAGSIKKWLWGEVWVHFQD